MEPGTLGTTGFVQIEGSFLGGGGGGGGKYV